MNRPRRFIGGVLMGCLCIAVFTTGRAWPGLLDGSDKMPPQPKIPPNGRIAPQRHGGMDGAYQIVSFATLGNFPFRPASQEALYKKHHTHD